MKKIDISSISSTAGMPIKSGTLTHLMQAYQEAITAIGYFLAGSYGYTPAQVYILSGCLESGSGLVHVISAGWVYFNNEIYQVDAQSFTCPAGQVPIGNIVTTFATGAQADPVGFTDGSSHNVLQIRKIVISSGVSMSGTTGGDFTTWNRTSSAALLLQLQSAFGGGATISFVQDQSIFFTTGPGASVSTLSFDMTNAIPGTVVRMKLAVAAGGTVNINTPASTTLVNLGGAITANKTNILTAEYCGINELGNFEVQYSVATL